MPVRITTWHKRDTPTSDSVPPNVTNRQPGNRLTYPTAVPIACFAAYQSTPEPKTTSEQAPRTDRSQLRFKRQIILVQLIDITAAHHIHMLFQQRQWPVPPLHFQ